MPKLRRRKKSTYSKWAKGLSYGGQIASAAFTGLSIATKLAGLINTEWKNHDTTQTNTSVATAGTIYNLSAIATGTDSESRIGKTILPKKIQLKMHLYKHASNNASFIRIILFRDKEYNGAAPAVTDLLDTAEYDSYYSLKDPNRFFVYADKTYNVNDSKTLTAKCQISIDMNKPRPKKKKWVHIEYLGTTAAAADAGNNQILLLVITDAASNNPTFDLKSRLRYIDN